MLQISDIVQLNSGGLEMRVVGFENQNVVVRSENQDVVVRSEAEETFPVVCVKKVTKGTSWAGSEVCGQG